MLNKIDFENIVWEFLFTYRQFLLDGYLHNRVNHAAYEANLATWNTLLISLEKGFLLGLARLLEREDDLGRTFNDGELDGISKKIINLRHTIAHADLSKMRNMNSFLSENGLTGTEGVKMFDALKSRLIQYQKNFKFNIDIQSLFTQSQNNALNDLDSWLKSFKIPL